MDLFSSDIDDDLLFDTDFVNFNSNQFPFSFPFKPYAEQEKLMTKLYSIMDEGKVGIIESPTGTGKSLMLICSSLKWLRDSHEKKLKGEGTVSFNELMEKEKIPIDNEEKSKETKSNEDSNNEFPDWLKQFTKDHSKLQAKKEYEMGQDFIKESLERDEAELRRYRALEPKNHQYKRAKKDHITIEQDDEDEFIVDEYYEKGNNNDNGDSVSEGSAADKVKELMKKFESIEQEFKDTQLLNKSNDNYKSFDFTKIYYATRTHSQLNQFIQELNNTQFAKDKSIINIPLMSRKQFCINETVRKSCKDSVDLINDKCSDLQSSSTSAKNRCIYYLPHERPRLVEFQQACIEKVQNIEDLIKLGEQRGICPYYGTKKSSKYAHLIPVPYTMLLSKSTREEANIQLKGNVVIIDEAHNLIDTIEAVHSTSFSLGQIVSTLDQITKYLDRYRSRLKGQNVVFLKQILLLLTGWKELFKVSETGVKVISSTELGFKLKLDQVNGWSLIQYLKESKLANKLHGFTTKILLKDSLLRSTMVNLQTSSRTHIHNLCTLLECLGYPSADGRVIITNTTEEQKLEYKLIDPTSYFKEILEEARSVIMIGGTMQPMEDFVQQLCSSVPRERICQITSGHVVPSKNVNCMTLSKGPSGKEFKFTFDNQSNFEMIDDLGRTVLNTCNIIPNGLVVFFQSYRILEHILERWKKLGSSKFSLLDQISKKKRVFIEPSNANRVDSVLESYSSWIKKCKDRKPNDPLFDGSKGAIILSVMGGKLSEGINFSDDLGRGVIVVGLPFPNKTNIKLQQKLEWLDKLKQMGTKRNSQAYYENLCMRTINQSIGRVIRHKDDYATIILVDSRFSQQGIIKKLPDWIQASLLNSKEDSASNVGILDYSTLTRKLVMFFTKMKQSCIN